jgi:hypothetical protein
LKLGSVGFINFEIMMPLMYEAFFIYLPKVLLKLIHLTLWSKQDIDIVKILTGFICIIAKII